MRQFKKNRLLAVAGIFLGLMMLFTQTALAQTNYATVTFFVIPAAGGSNVTGSTGSVSLNCGWHVSCVSPYPGGTGVDWGSSNRTVYLRAKVVDSLVTASTASVYAKVSGRTVNGCPQVVAQIWAKNKVTDTTDDERVMNVIFMHTTWNTTTKTVNFNASRTGVITGAAVGTMHDDTNGGCSWGGFHVHSDQESVSGFTISRNTTDIPNAAGPCSSSSDAGACNTFNGGGTTWTPASHWERKVAWSYCYSGCPL